MDCADFIRMLQQELESGPYSASKKQIIRFLNRQDYQRFIARWKQLRSKSAPAVIQQLNIIQAISCPLPSSKPLKKFNGLVAVEEDRKVTMHSLVYPTRYPSQAVPWGVKQIKAPQVWPVTMGYGVHVGVIDTGVDFFHPDLRGSVLRGINLVHRGLPPQDDNGHGTHIAGTIAAGSRFYGITGVAPRAAIHPVKAFDHNGTAYISDIILGIDWCVANRMDIINMSFGMKTRSNALLDAIKNAYNAGIVVVASSGNASSRNSVDYPARYPHTISVGATDRNRKIAPFSNRGKGIDIYAPGEQIVSSWIHGRYNRLSGTSMATSHVSGAIALLLSVHPGLSPAEIKSLLRKSAQRLRGVRRKSPATGELHVPRLLLLSKSSR